MIQSYDFIIHAVRNEYFRDEVMSHINSPDDSEIIYCGKAILKFDSKNKKIIELRYEGHPKICPLEISYQDFIRVMEIEDDSRYDYMGAACKLLE